MEDGNSSKANATATRKRRSSILKSQRAPRTPFSELEFNVTTPTDTAKSRRVSFSRRTGVAEFVTNEATTTWKNFYEEHNKSLESSGNDSEANASRRPSALGSRISFFEKQFQEVEGVDFVETLNPRNPNFNVSVSQINFTDQITCTSDKKLEAPQQHFELSSFTDHQTKLFEDDIAVPAMCDVSDKIDLNFSMMQTIGANKDNDDFEQLQRDVEQGQSGQSNCPDIFQDGKDVSEYITFDLNTTHVSHNVSDMSITDTILSPKVQNVSKSNSVAQVKNVTDKDWVADKENIVVNPYVAPKETEIFAINEEPDKVLVFDGKKLTIQKTDSSVIDNKADTKERPQAQPHRKTIVLNVHDDLPNFVDELSVSRQLAHKFENTEISNDDISNISITQAVPTNIISGEVKIHERRRTILFNTYNGDMSLTKSNIHGEQNITFTDKRKTIVFEDYAAEISVTQVLPTNIFDARKTESERVSTIQSNDSGHVERTNDKRKTIVFEDDAAEISMTQAIPANIFNNSKTDHDREETNRSKAHLNVTSTDKRKTIVFEDDAADISMTQGLPTKIFDISKISSDKRKTIIYDDSNGDVSMTQMLPLKVIPVEFTDENPNKTLSCDISMTQAVPQNVILVEDPVKSKRNTIVFQNTSGDVSITQAIPSYLLMSQKPDTPLKINSSEIIDISMTQALPANIIMPDATETEKCKTIVHDDTAADISCTQVIPSNIILRQPSTESTRNDIRKITNISELEESLIIDRKFTSGETLMIPKLNESRKLNNSDNSSIKSGISINSSNGRAARRKSVEFDLDQRNLSLTKAVQSQVLDDKVKEATQVGDLDDDDHNAVHANESLKSVKSATIFFEDGAPEITMADISVTQEKPTNISDTINDKEEETVNKDNHINNTIVLEQAIESKDPSSPTIPKKEDLSKTQEVLDQINAIVDSPNPNKLVTDNFDCLPQSRLHSLSKPIDIIPNTTYEQVEKSKNEDVLKKPNQNVLIYQATTSHGNIYSRKRSIKDDSSEPESSFRSSELTSTNSVYSKQSDLAEKRDSLTTGSYSSPPVNNSQSFSSRPTETENTSQSLASNENFVIQSADFPDNCVPDNCALNRCGETKKCQSMKCSPDKMKSVLHDLLDMSNASLEAQVDTQDTSTNSMKSVHLASEFLKSLKSSDLKKSFSSASSSKLETLGGDRVLLVIQGNDAEKERSTVKVPIVGKPRQLEPEDFERDQATGTEAESFEGLKTSEIEQIVKTNDLNEIEKSFVKNDTISILNIQTDSSVKYLESNSNESAKGFVTIIRDESDGVPTVESNTIDVHRRIGQSRSSIDALAARRRSYIPRHSTINREDFLSNISMAQQILQNTKLDSSADCSMNDAATEVTANDFYNMDRSRTNSEVVKKLQFEDSVSEVAVSGASILKETPLRKSYPEHETQDNSIKPKVIPSYLKYVSEELKDLMNDLVKPTADTMPFEGCDEGNSHKHGPHASYNLPNREVSMCSNQIQASLVASSQIDCNTELTSDTDSMINLSNATHHSKIKSVSFASAIKMTVDSEPDLMSPGQTSNTTTRSQSILQVSPRPGHQQSKTKVAATNPVIVFDNNNPLNNILLSPVSHGEYVKHEPFLPKIAPPNNDGPERCSIQYHINNITGNDSPLQSGDTADLSSNQSSIRFNLEKPSFTNQSVSVQFYDRKDTTVNTIIAMKGNKDLLKASSLTLVEEAGLDNSGDTGTTTTVTSKESSIILTKPNVKGKKRLFSPDVKKKPVISSSDSTPNPSRKMIKLTTPQPEQHTVSSSDVTSGTSNGLDGEKSNTSTLELIYSSENTESSEKPKKKRFSMFKKRKSKTPEPESSATSFMTPQSSDANEVLVKKILKKETPDLSPPPISRRRGDKHVKFPRPKQQGKMNKNFRVQQVLTKYVLQSNVLTHNYVDNSSDETNQSKNGSGSNNSTVTKVITNSDTNSNTSKTSLEHYSTDESFTKTVYKLGSSVNVIPQINVLPFMGTYKCEWESATNDTWSFRLLHRRLRLCVRFEHKIDNALKTCVRTDTPIQSITLYTAHQDKGNNIGLSCVKYASKSILYIISQDKYNDAGTIPRLLKKCAAIAGIAMNWARAMYDARIRLSYDLNEDDEISLKVANIPLRSVWEVTLRLESVTKDDGEIPWPKAMNIKVKPVVADDEITEEELENVIKNVPTNWGHVPHTIWTIFKYLKNKRKDDLSMFPALNHIRK